MNPMDISALFGNALDNAIESVKKLPNPEQRLIHVSAMRQKDFLRIRVENCYSGELRFVDDNQARRALPRLWAEEHPEHCPQLRRVGDN